MAVGDFFNEGIMLKVRIAFYGIIVIFSFLVMVGVTMMREKALDACPLYLEKKRLMYVYSGSASNCNFPIAIAVIFHLIYPLARGISLILMLLDKISKEHSLFTGALFGYIFVAIELCGALLTLVGACILHVGAYWESPSVPFEWRPAAEVARIGAWVNFVLLMKLGVAGLLILWKSGKLPCFKGSQQASSPNKEGETRREMVDPASEKFGI